jgi:hypothetical protein
MFTDVKLGGAIDGVELAYLSAQRYPNIHVIVTSGTLPLEGIMSNKTDDIDLLRYIRSASTPAMDAPCTRVNPAGGCRLYALARATCFFVVC